MSSLFNNNVRRGGEHGEGGDDGEQGERDEAEPVEDHRRELPVALYGRRLLVVTNLVRYHFNFFQDEAEFPRDTGGVGRGGGALILFCAARTSEINMKIIL